MGFRFRKSFKIAPGVRLNLGKKSVGVSVGGKGARVSVNSNGRVTKSASIPGTGISYVESKKIGSKRKKAVPDTESVQTFDHSSASNNQADINSGITDVSPSPKKKSKKKLIIGIVVALVIIAAIGSLASEAPDSISANWPGSTFDINDTPKVGITASPDDANISDLVICGNDIAEMDYSDGVATIKFLKEGSASIYFISSDVESNHAYITVIDEAAEAQRLQEEQVAAEEQARLEEEKLAQEAAQQEAQQQLESQQATSSPSTSPGSTAQQAPQQPQQTQMVWIASSGNGTKYHSDPTCSNMKNPTQISIDEAIGRGKTPCSKCY